jgi:GH15 family glucan-1,4-alpha-glucosidase
MSDDGRRAPDDGSEGRTGIDIDRHGVIGDLRTIALVDDAATIDWMCWPRFDSPSLFGRLLDPDGGHWSLRVTGDDVNVRQLYLPDTNVLITRFHHEHGVVEVEDFMVIDPASADRARGLVRRVSGVRGELTVRSELVPRPDYGRAPAAPTDDGAGGATLDHGGEQLRVRASVEQRCLDDRVVTELTVAEGVQVTFSLGPAGQGDVTDRRTYDDTVRFWREWIARSQYTGRWRETVDRSALTLKLLTDRDSGGLLAAGTTSLPEVIGGERNWDYRYVWVRDAAFTLYAFIELGLADEAAAFTGWLEHRVHRSDDDASPPLAPLYDLDGDHDLAEHTLDHWRGYRDSRPVRVGNAASGQIQLDIYGELIDSLYLADKHGSGLSTDVWNDVRHLVEWVCDHWKDLGNGMWEGRGEPRRYTSSLVMCWVAIERAMRMARRRGRPGDIERWRAVRDEIHETVMEHCWSDELGAFTQSLDDDVLDASVLLMPLVKFLPPTDPKWLSTLDAIDTGLAHDALVDRYDGARYDDGLRGDEGSFTICSFWFVEALARSGHTERARLLFDKLLTYASPLGLYAEQISRSGRQLGNFPQALTHLALISAAVHLDEALDGDR